MCECCDLNKCAAFTHRFTRYSVQLAVCDHVLLPDGCCVVAETVSSPITRFVTSPTLSNNRGEMNLSPGRPALCAHLSFSSLTNGLANLLCASTYSCLAYHRVHDLDIRVHVVCKHALSKPTSTKSSRTCASSSTRLE